MAKAQLSADLLGGVQKELHRRHSLLAVNHFSAVNVPGCRWDLLDHYGSEEMLYRSLFRLDCVSVTVFELFKVSLSHVPHIIPEGLPLLVMSPDVWSLKPWNRVTDLLLEKVSWE